MNPNHPGWYWYTDFFYHFNLGQYEDAASVIHKVNLPGHWAMHAFAASSYGHLGQKNIAERSAEELRKLRPDIRTRARRDLEKWQSPETTEKIIEGLRLAGLEID